MKYFTGLLCLAFLAGGCATLKSLESQSQREYYIDVDADLPDSPVYYIDQIDSSALWSEHRVQVKVKF